VIVLHFPNYYAPSQNTRDVTHWAERKRINDALLYVARSQMAADDVCMPGHFRYVEIMCYRRQLITDDANYRGGAKGLVDVLKRAGAIHDDKDKFVKITYRQDLLRNAPNKRPLTIVRVSAEPFTSEE